MIRPEALKAAAKDPAWIKRLETEPEKTVDNLTHPLASDVWLYRVVVGVLGLAVLGAMYGIFVLAQAATAIPDALTAIGSAAVGALAGLLAPSPKT